MSKPYNHDNDWLSTSQSNENGTSNGGWNGRTNKWEANVYVKATGDHFFYTSISHRKVNTWLEDKRKQYDLR